MATIPQRTRVGIVGAGPAGLLLGYLLQRRGIECVILEAKDREYLETHPRRIRAGVMEWGTREILIQAGVGGNLTREGMEHQGIYVAVDGKLHRIDFPSLTGGYAITVYGQQYLVRDMIAAHLEMGSSLFFETEVVGVENLETSPLLIYKRPSGPPGQIRCDFVVAADGSHSLFRSMIPRVRIIEQQYPFAWLAILAETRPAAEELIYASHHRGFALFSMRSPMLARNYLQVDPDARLEEWSDQRIWEELNIRLGGGADIQPGPLLEKSIVPMRSLIVEPMQYGRLFLVGDAAHVVPPAGAKGMNMAVADVIVLFSGLTRYYEDNDSSVLDDYTARCLRHVWQAEFFSWWWTFLLHVRPDPFEERLRQTQLRNMLEVPHLQRFFAENYVGLYTTGRYVEFVQGTKGVGGVA